MKAKNTKLSILITAIVLLAVFIAVGFAIGNFTSQNEQAEITALTKTAVADLSSSGWDADTFVKYSPTFNVKGKEAEYAKFIEYAKSMGASEGYEKLNFFMVQTMGEEKLAKIQSVFNFEKGKSNVTVLYRKAADKDWEVTTINVTRVN